MISRAAILKIDTICAAVALWAVVGSPPATSQGTPASRGSAPAATTHAGGSDRAKSTVPTGAGDKTGDRTTGSAPALTMQLRRDVTGDLSYRFVTPQDESAAPAPLPAATGTTNTVVLPVTVNPAGAALEVIDTTRSKVAHLPVATAGVTPLTDADFNLLLAVLVPVQSKGRAVVNATVTLTAGDNKSTTAASKEAKPAPTGASKGYSRSWLLKPSDAGVATFANVPLGTPVTVTVSSGSDTPVSQTLTLPTNPPADGYRWQTIEVPWPGVHTVALPAAPAPVAAGAPAPAPTAATPAPAAPAPQQGNTFVSDIVSLLIMAGFIYGVYWAYKQGHIKKVLDNLGIQTQPVAATNGPQGSPFDKPARAPIQPITEGTADPLGGAGFGTAVAAAPPVPSAGPRLVATMGAYAGNIFPLAGSVTDIGRDAANPVPLPQDTNASRRHATIQAANGGYTVTDNDSSNGTYINGVRINSQTPQALRPGDELQIGMTRFRFEA